MTPAAPATPAVVTAIDGHAVIGDCRTLALVSHEGDIDWCCLPAFSSPSVFGALLDAERGGRCSVAPRQVLRSAQAYVPHSNVLVTRFECDGGVLELHDAMTWHDRPDGAPQEIVRHARCIEGSVELAVLLQPRPGYAETLPRLHRDDDRHWHCAAPGTTLHLHASVPLVPVDGDALGATLRLRAGEGVALLLRTPTPLAAHEADDLCATAAARLHATQKAWQAWCARCTYTGPHAEAVRRSCLALKLLTHRPTGAVVAAGTTSLPAADDGQRNWDYRYCWLRDASLVQHALLDMGFTDESDGFLGWLLHATHRTRPCLQVVYDVLGETSLDETTLPWLAGWRGLGPVRVGNAASDQQQHDIYGEVILAAWHHVHCGGTLNDQERSLIAGFVEQICHLWRRPDHGIWEIRLAPRHNTHSKLLCWAGLDRALVLQQRIGLPIDAPRITAARDAVRAEIEARGWNAQRGSYVGYYGGDAVDASLLLMVRLGFHPPAHPRLQATVQRILDDLSVRDEDLADAPSNGLLYRYPPGPAYDGVGGHEHLFALCSFWCVGALAMMGRLDEAHRLYERLLALRNPVGLYAEEFNRHDGRPMGNFPQAFSHVGSITAASLLAQAEASRHGRAEVLPQRVDRTG